jgi:5-methylcytosine-specific restriction endonuclease McrBC regulatory subunit McrC
MASILRNTIVRDRGLIKLKDQLGSYKLPIKRVKGYEKNRHSDFVANNFINVNYRSFDALDITPSICFDNETISIQLRTNGVIGAAPLFSIETRKIIGGIIVEPKFGWNDIGPLLSAIGWSASPNLLDFPMIPGSAKEIPPWVLAGPMIERLSILLHNLNRGFDFIKEIRDTPRGKIDWQDYVSHSIPVGKFNKIPCVFPDLNENNILRAFIKWGLERIKFSILQANANDITSISILTRIESMLNLLKDVQARTPSKNALDSMLKNNRISTDSFILGIQALTWIREEKGLAGQREPDGLAWNMRMSDLFERWVESIARTWASKFGGIISTSRQDSSRVSIHWSNPGLKSLSNLSPDVVIETPDTVYIIDAKYKKLYEELDDQKWRELSKELQEDHRHDLHQVLAYASLYNKPRIVSILAYPLTDETYTDLTRRSRLLNRASISIENKILEFGILGLPLSVNQIHGTREIAEQLDPLRFSLVEY